MGADLRIANAIYRRAFEARGHRTVQGRVGPATMELDLAEWPQAQAFLVGRYDPSTVHYVLSRLSPSGVMIDAGAHVGLIAFQVAVRRPEAHIHAFEPHPESAASFRRNLAHHRSQSDQRPIAEITLNEVGLSSAEGVMEFDFTSHSSHHREGAPGSIPVTTLDAYLSKAAVDRVDVLKLDVEGHESAALRGARGALREHRIGAVVLETMDAHGPLEQAHAVLAAAGYRQVPLPDLRSPLIRRLRPFAQRENAAYEPTGP